MPVPRPFGIVVAVLVLAALAPARFAAGAEITFGFTRPTNTSNSAVEFEIESNGMLERVTVPIPAGSSAGSKRNAIKQALTDNLFDVADVGLTGLRIEGLRPGTKVKFKPGNTGEEADTQTAMGIPSASFGFANSLFSPLNAQGQPAVFTGGFITDFGQFTAQVSAGNLPLTSGFAITQALYAQLAPQAALFGAEIVNGGDMMTVSFNPAFATGEVGVIYGTTSLTPGVFGDMTAVPEPAALAAIGLTAVLLVRRRRRR